LKLAAPHHRLIVDSLLKQPINSLLEIAKSQVTCPVLEALLSAPNISGKDKRSLMLKFIGHYPTLADDRNGSRAADACWAAADVYLKVRQSGF
jgi:nucleolar protein 9